MKRNLDISMNTGKCWKNMQWITKPDDKSDALKCKFWYKLQATKTPEYLSKSYLSNKNTANKHNLFHKLQIFQGSL